MKSAVLSLAAMFLCLFAAQLQAQEDEKYFDMENCEICQCMAEHEEIMMHVKWDITELKNGMLMVMVVPDEHKAVMEEAHAKMMETAANLKEGAHMCGFCKDYGSLMESGALFEEKDTVAGKITVVTSDDPKVVAKIHEVAKKAKTAHEAMVKEMSGGR